MGKQNFKNRFISISILLLLVLPVLTPIVLNLLTDFKFNKTLEFYTNFLIPGWVLFFSIWYLKIKIQLKSLQGYIQTGDQQKDVIYRSSISLDEQISRIKIIDSKQSKARNLKRDLEGLEYIIAAAGIFAGFLSILKYLIC